LESRTKVDDETSTAPQLIYKQPYIGVVAFLPATDTTLTRSTCNEQNSSNQHKTGMQDEQQARSKSAVRIRIQGVKINAPEEQESGNIAPAMDLGRRRLILGLVD
jgi:hypothetical protein